MDLHPQGSVYHTPFWLEALRRTYRYTPLALTTCASGGQLRAGIPFCRVKSWVSGSRLVSLPFSDHCQPLLPSEDLATWLSLVSKHLGQNDYKYIEIRPLETLDAANLRPVIAKAVMSNCGRLLTVEKYNYHKLDLRPDLVNIFDKFHRSCIQRRIERARREHLQYEAGRSEWLLEGFYRLLLLTRRRHGLPPQPKAWFRNLIDCFGENLTIRVLCQDNRAIAGILTLVYKNKVVYKYGCSDVAFHRTGAMPLLFWKTIEEEKGRGAEELDLGRSDINNPGLSTFKEHLGGVRSELFYFSVGSDPRHGICSHGSSAVHAVFTRMPAPLAKVAGRMLYKHIG